MLDSVIVVTEGHLILSDTVWWMVGNGIVDTFRQEGRELCMASHTHRAFHWARTNGCKSRQQRGFMQRVLYFYWRITSARNVKSTAVWMWMSVTQSKWACRNQEFQIQGNAKGSQRNGGYNLINSTLEWQQQRWSSLPAAEWREGMCESSTEMHSSYTTPHLIIMIIMFALSFRKKMLTADLKLKTSQEFLRLQWGGLNETKWVDW